MNNPISFMGANFVARELGYRSEAGKQWGHYQNATVEAFRPLAGYRERICTLLDEIQALGFGSFDLWVAHLHPLWATPEHIETVREEAARRMLSITSLAGGFGGSLVEFRACCRMAAALNIPVLGGMTPVLSNDRPGMVRALREFGLLFALENHPEATPADLLAKLGDGEEEVLKAALDTGWFGTHGFPADEAVRVLADRLAIVHLKDIREAGSHDTCALGDGIVPIRKCLQALREVGYPGPISIEHEPFDEDPREACRAGREMVAAVVSEPVATGVAFRPVGMAVVGCGNISAKYGTQLSSYPEVNLLGAYDIDAERASTFVAEYGGKAYSTLEEVLDDPEVEVVVNLSIHQAHYEIISQCLRSGKHVHTEKPLATTPAQAWELVDLARECRLRLSSAPTTWLGEAQQTAWSRLESGSIGTPRVAYAEINWGRIESWHPNPAPFYAVGPVFDVAVYPITLLTTWFGPVRSVIAGGGILYPDRQTRDGAPFKVESEDWTAAVLQFESGPMARLTSSFYVQAVSSQSGLEVHGDLGTIRMQRWDVFNTRVEVGPYGQAPRRIPLLRPGFAGIEFARGARDLAIAMREERPHRCTGEQAAHVVEICQAILDSTRSGKRVEIESGFPAPAPLEWAVEAARALRASAAPSAP